MQRNNEPGYMLPYGCLGTPKLTKQTNGKRNEERNERQIAAVVSVPVMLPEPESSPHRLFSGRCPETAVDVQLDTDRSDIFYCIQSGNDYKSH